MKLTVIGAGGIRMPLFVRSLLRRIENGATIETLAMNDIQPERLAIMGKLARHLVAESGVKLDVVVEPDLDKALAGSDAVVTTIRPGFEAGRIADENICKAAGILGQETVGAGGFAMAARAIPDLLAICARVRAVCPQAMILNFTNPAGIVTQALQDAGYDNVVGICDSADNVKDYVALSFDVDPSRIRTRVFGLNHLSATTQVWIDDEDVTAKLMADDTFLEKWFGIFGADLVRKLGALPNEYLYYYLLPEQAVPAVLAEPEGRGAKVLRITERFFAGAKDPQTADDPAALLKLHAACMSDRESSYMEYAWKDTDRGQRPDHHLAEGEGYAGVALNVIEGKWRAPVELALIVPNRGAVDWLAHSDVAEITCRVDANGITPIAPNVVPPMMEKLVHEMRVFESLTVLTVRHQNKRLAKWALSSHPLVGMRNIVEKVLDKFAATHPAVGSIK
jgi:alpha-galactosidase/6-phospho-beta-glucosidase family protein